jgi:hypothetical protein
MTTYRVSNFANLFGDFLGAICALDFLSRNNDICFLLDEKNDAGTGNTIHAERFFYPFIDLLKNDKIRILKSGDTFDGQIDADAVRADDSYGGSSFMSRAYYHYFCRQIFGTYSESNIYPKPELTFIDKENKIKEYDFLISPYGRSSSLSERISLATWAEFIKLNKDKTFGILGQFNSDDYSPFVDLANCEMLFSNTFNDLGVLYKKVRNAVLTIVTGTSVFCYATNTKNILFTNYKREWANNPDAIKITKAISEINVNDIMEACKL